MKAKVNANLKNKTLSTTGKQNKCFYNLFIILPTYPLYYFTVYYCTVSINVVVVVAAAAAAAAVVDLQQIYNLFRVCPTFSHQLRG